MLAEYGLDGSQVGLLGERARLDGAVHLVGADLQVARDSAVPRGLEQRVRAEDVGADEVLRAADGAVDVGLGGEVDDGVGAARRLGDAVASQMSPCTKL